MAIVDQKRVRWAKETLSFSPSLSFSSCTYNAYPFPVFVLWSPTRYYVSREWQFERSHSRERPFSANKGSTYADFIFFFSFFFISISSPALIRSHCSRFVHPALPPSPGCRLNRPYRERQIIQREIPLHCRDITFLFFFVFQVRFMTAVFVDVLHRRWVVANFREFALR